MPPSGDQPAPPAIDMGAAAAAGSAELELPRLGWRAGLGIALGLAALAGTYLHTLRDPRTIAGLKVGGEPVGGLAPAELEARLDALVNRFLDGGLVLVLAADRVHAGRRELGFVVDREQLTRAVRGAGKTGNPWDDLAARSRARRGRLELSLPIEIDRERALEYLIERKDELDRAATDARLDLERHTVAAEQPGYLVRVYDSMVALEYAARSGATEVKLRATLTPPRVRAGDLEGMDISTVLGRWETRYSASAIDSDRTYNLKVGADKLNGHILKPGEIFSFNQVVGDRTEKEGYRVAPVIQGGELIDGLAGGMCQIASTLHAAAFFSGLDIVSSTPHSRPSAYIPMGLDSTVVYPSVDLKLRNPYEFPVVMHYQVNQGSVKVELLGRERPYKVLLEREIKSETGFGTETRADREMPEGQRIILQAGYPGYTLVRRRYLFPRTKVPRWSGPEPVAALLERQHATPIAKQQWALKYPPTTQFVAVGQGSPELSPKPTPPAHRIPPLNPRDKPLFKLLK